MRWLIVSFVIFVLGLLNFFAPIRGSIQYVFNPVQYGVQQLAVGLKDSVEFYSGLRGIRQENIVLLSENEYLESEVFRLQNLGEENVLLRKQLDLLEEEDTTDRLVLARTLGNVDDKTGTSLMLDKGSAQGINVSDVVVRENFLIGIVREVTPYRSKIELISSPDISISVRDFQSGTEGISLGQFGTFLKVSRILPGEIVNVGDVFITSGRDGIFPPGYIVGEVSSVSTESAETLKEVVLDAIIDLESVTKVFVITESTE